MPFQTVTNIALNEVAIAKNASTSTTAWIPAKGAEGFNFWAYMTSAGAADVSINIEVALIEPGTRAGATLQSDGLGLFDPDSTVRTNYRTIAVKANETNKAAWQHYNTPAELSYPITHYRIQATENNVAAVTTLTVLVAHNGMRY